YIDEHTILTCWYESDSPLLLCIQISKKGNAKGFQMRRNGKINPFKGSISIYPINHPLMPK
ncbi:MAG: hypothetical protein ACR2KX_08940, partial [Chitinophagaceae bacterium]